MAETSTTTTRLISVLIRGLTTERSPTRAPDNFDASLKAACSEPDSSISRALLQAGFQVWFAYFLALQENARGLDPLLPEDVDLVTSQVSGVSPHRTVRQLFSHLFQGWRGKKRQEWLDSIDAQAPTSPGPSSPGPRPSKRRRFSIHDPSMQDQSGAMANSEITHEGQLSAANTSNADDRAQGAVDGTLVALHGVIGFNFDPRTQFAWPAASQLGLVFPTYLTRAIVKVNGNAWLRACFEDDFAKCELDFFIIASETQHIASQLFDIHIQTKGQKRGMLLHNKVFVEVDGSLIFSGSSPRIVNEILGDQVAEAYQASPSRAEELSNGEIEITSCLNMEIWPEADCPSRLRLRVEVGKLSMIVNNLWPAGMLPMTGN